VTYQVFIDSAYSRTATYASCAQVTACMAKSLTLRHFWKLPTLLSRQWNPPPDPVDTWLQELGRPRRVAVTVPHYIEALHLVAQTELIVVIPERLVRAYSSVLNLVMKTVPLDVGTFAGYLLHLARTHADPGCSWLRELIRSVCPDIDRSASRRDARINVDAARAL
jgi:DNA-binding transcriptional LysR family regulator